MIEEMKGVDSNIESDVVDWEIASDEEVLAIGFEKGVEFCFRDLNESGKIKGVSYGN